MMVFPQIGTGAQYPVKVTRRYRTLMNISPGRHTVRYGDSQAGAVVWSLDINGLNDADWATLETFFESCEGRLRGFTFLDPVRNLLAHSEDLTEQEWQVDPMIQLSSGVADISGGDRASRLTNTGQTHQGIQQTLAAPGAFQYTMSVFARAAGGDSTILRLGSPGASSERVFALSDGWKRLSLSASLAPADEEVTFGVVIPSGAAVDLYGLQAEAQPAASDYKRSSGKGGVVADAHFDQDELRRVTEAAEFNSTQVRIEAPMEGF